MPIIDLTHPIHAGMPVYPGDQGPTLAPAATIDHDGYQTTSLTLTTHTGTHLDAPAHLLLGGRTLDRFPASHFCGPARVVDCRGVGGEIDLPHLEPLANLQGAEFILLRTGWSRYWGTADYFYSFPVLSPTAAAWLAELPIKGIGMDTPSLDPAQSATLANHRLFLSREIVVIENLTNLDTIPGPSCQLYCLPLLVAQTDGAPARVIAVL